MKSKVNKKRATDMKELTKNFDSFIEGKEHKENGKEVFEEVVQKAIKKKKDQKK